jgi:hypothetical protein
MDKGSEMYINLLEKVLIDYHRIEKGEYRPLTWGVLSWKQKLMLPLERLLRLKDYAICKFIKPNINARLIGHDWPYYADTMIGLKRIQNIKECVIDTIQNNIKGDLIETGVWRGGATIYMRALLKILDVKDKKVWVADSFEGLPKPNENQYVHDTGDDHIQDLLKVSIEDVKHNFSKYDLLDEQVVFLKGWFKDTLPTAAIQQLSILRLDGDMYESTMDALTNLYPKLSIGGYIIIDDYNAIKNCRQAVEDYRLKYNISEKIIAVDKACVFWKKTK